MLNFLAVLLIIIILELCTIVFELTKLRHRSFKNIRAEKFKTITVEHSKDAKDILSKDANIVSRINTNTVESTFNDNTEKLKSIRRL